MTDKEFTKKLIFVEQVLINTMQSINEDIVKVEYILDIEPQEEYVYIFYKNGYWQKICVTADSLYAIALDVLRSMSK